MPTVFERLLGGELPCAKVYEDELVFAFMDAGQVNDGHVLSLIHISEPTRPY